MKPKTDVWMPLYIGDYLADTIGLSLAQHGAYLLLMMAYWKNKGPLTDATARSIIRELEGQHEDSSRTPQGERKDSIERIAGFFQVKDGLWHHKRIGSELEKANRVTELKSEGGKRRWSKGQIDDSSRTPQGLLKDSISPSQSQSHSDQKTGSAVNAFEQFWQAYPKKIARFDAEHAFVEVDASRFMPQILAAITRQQSEEAWTKDNGKFIPAPARWLRDGRWHDKPARQTAPETKPAEKSGKQIAYECQ